ncbi:hypothetical protein V7V80_19500 [Pseudomonas kermanshahensis]|uniref:CSD domain-containing protein n=1 Tax=Pseudomonas kermanshahensis TaxID=2745482 RepID=A0ABU8RAE5_9PSED|nr:MULTISPECIES: hypothetical protein [Pseudomonas]MBC3484496.1 hypothetical protein [Pseudomonas sp. SWRI50]MBC3495556.1 hypothetical protein [Pseudomonas sp. SWRI67]MBV4527314.1 hypothetical protein [Pseudomonas kermanshahensis]
MSTVKTGKQGTVCQLHATQKFGFIEVEGDEEGDQVYLPPAEAGDLKLKSKVRFNIKLVNGEYHATDVEEIK